MGAVEGIETYYQLFGCQGVFLAAKARSLHKSIKASVVVPGLEHPVHLRVRTTDVSAFRQVFVTAEYDFELCKQPRVIIDAGANIGLTSVFYANKYPAAKIIAIEPEHSNFEMLKLNVAPYGNITPIHAALWRAHGRVTLIDPGLGHYGFQTIARERVEFNVRLGTAVPAVTINELITDFNLSHIDILKIDIEGSEKEVFETADSWVSKVGIIAVELHEHLRVGCTRSVYSGVKDLEVEWRCGETVFFARPEYVTAETLRATGREKTLEFRKKKAFEIVQDA